MRPLKWLARFYVELLNRLGLFRFSVLLAALIIVLSVTVQWAMSYWIGQDPTQNDLLRSIFFALLITPWGVYFLSAVVDQQEESRQRLTRLVDRLQKMRERDKQLNEQYRLSLQQMEQEMMQRTQAEHALQKEITHREQVQQELQQRSALLRSFIDCSPDLVYYRNEQGQFSGCNRAMEALIGRKEHELIGLTPYDVYDAETASSVVETDKEVFASNQGITYEQWLSYPDGRKAHFELRKVPFFDEANHRIGLLGFGRDITERKRYEQRLERASREKTAFISTLSHELRTPLNGIVGLSRLLLDSDLNDEQREMMRTLYISAITLGNIFSDVIDLDKLERDKLNIVNEAVEIRQLVSDVTQLARLMAEEKGLTFASEFDEQLPDALETDGTRLRQVLWNLLGNAVKFTEHGEVRLSVKRSDGLLRIEVQDTGIGLAEEDLQRVFAMYYQVGSIRHATGTGIGLAVCRALVEAMGGSIGVDSVLGKGSCFWINLPLVSAQLSAQEQLTQIPPHHILLVEDVELNVRVAKGLLEKYGHHVDVAMSGQAAIDMAKSQHYELILLDIQLPDMSGFDVADHLQQELEICPPLIALTANVIHSKDEYLARGMDDALGKPLSRKALAAMFARLMGEDLPAQTLSPTPKADVLDETMLRSFIDAVGVACFSENLMLLEQLVPGYLEEMAVALSQQHWQEAAEHAHKMKGAFGSVGLARCQRVAQLAQDMEQNAWHENIELWFVQLQRHWRDDLQRLRLWLKDYGSRMA